MCHPFAFVSPGGYWQSLRGIFGAVRDAHFYFQSGDSSELAPRLPCKGKSVRNRGVSQTMPFLVIPRSLLRGGFIRWGLLHACTCATHMCNTHALDCLGTHLCRVTHPLRDSAGGLAT